MKIKESLELTATARVLGDIEAKVLVVEAGAAIAGRVSMPGLENLEPKQPRLARAAALKKPLEEAPAVTL